MLVISLFLYYTLGAKMGGNMKKSVFSAGIFILFSCLLYIIVFSIVCLVQDDNKGVRSEFSKSGVSREGNLAYSTQWGKQEYTITYNLNGGSFSYTPRSTFTVDDCFLLPKPTRQDYTFKGWYTNANLVGIPLEWVSWGTNCSLNLYARWEANLKQSYLITYVVDGEKSYASFSPYSYVVLKTPQRVGYTFDGWYSEPNYAQNKASVVYYAASDKTFYGRFLANSYSINYNLNGGSSQLNLTSSCKFDEVLYLPNPTRENYSFVGWTASNLSSTAQTLNEVEYSNWYGATTTNTYFKNLSTGGTVYLTANWKYNPPIEQTYSIKYELGLDNVKGVFPTSVKVGESCYISNPTCNGATFVGWTALNLGTIAQTSANGYSYSIWAGSSTKNCYFKNLANAQGVVTMVAQWESQRLSSITQDDNSSNYYLFNSSNNSGVLYWVSKSSYAKAKLSGSSYNTAFYGKYKWAPADFTLRTYLSSADALTKYTWEKENGLNNLNEKFTTMRFRLYSSKKDYSIVSVEIYFNGFALMNEFVVDWVGWKEVDLELASFQHNGAWKGGETNLSQIYIKATSWEHMSCENTFYLDYICFTKKSVVYKLGGSSYTAYPNVAASNYLLILSEREKFLVNSTGLDNDEGGKMAAKVEKARSNLYTGLTFPKTLTTSNQMTKNYIFIFEMAEGYAVLNNTEQLTAEQKSLKSNLLNKINQYLKAMNESYYSVGYGNSIISGDDNWFDWEIDSPQYFIDTLVLIRDSLSLSELKSYLKYFDAYIPMPVRTGESIFATAKSCVIVGALERDYARIETAKKCMLEAMQYVEHGDGFYLDGSYIQHKYFAYNDHYGIDGLYRLVQTTDLLNGTVFALSDNDYAQQYDLLTRCFMPLTYDGVALDLLRGRLPVNHDRIKGEHLVYAMALMTNYLTNKTDLMELKSIIKLIYNNAYTGTSNFYYNSTSIYSTYMIIKILLQINNDSLVVTKSGYDEVKKMFASMDVALATYYNEENELISIGISMSSDRIAKYETKGKNFVNGWYSGDGMTYIYEDVDDYGWGYWSVDSVDKGKVADTTMLPGTTITNAARERVDVLNTEKFSKYSFVGGTQNGKYLASAMQLDGSCGSSFSTTLKANKSYFVFDNFMLCVGNGISCSDSYEVYTVIENRKLTNASKLYFDSVQQNITQLKKDTEYKLNTNKIYLIGYGAIYIPNNVGNLYYKITSNNYLIIYFKHGVRCAISNNYAYAIYPSKSATLAQLMNKVNKISNLIIDKNTVYCTQVSYNNVTQCAFWPQLNNPNVSYSSSLMNSGSYLVSAACVLIHDKTTHKLSLADPMQLGKSITLTYNGRSYVFNELANGQTQEKSI